MGYIFIQWASKNDPLSLMIFICEMKSCGSSFCSLKSHSNKRWTSLGGEPETTLKNKLKHNKEDTVLGERREIKPTTQKTDWVLALLHLNVFLPLCTAASENDTTRCFWPICKCNLNMQKLFLKFRQCSSHFFSQLLLHFTNECHSLLLEQPCFTRETSGDIMLSNPRNRDAKGRQFLCLSVKAT